MGRSKIINTAENIDTEKIKEALKNLTEGKIETKSIISNLKERYGNVPFIIAGVVVAGIIYMFCRTTPESVAKSHINRDLDKYYKGRITLVGLSERPESKNAPSEAMHGYYAHFKNSNGISRTEEITVLNHKIYYCGICSHRK